MNQAAFVAENAIISGDVSIGKDSSIWFGSVVRTEKGKIEIGEGSNVQDNCTLHADSTLTIGRFVTVGHGAIVHCSSIGDNTLIGMGAILLDGAKIGRNCIIAAGALVRENEIIDDNSVVVGVPGKIKRQVSSDEIETIKNNAAIYIEKAKSYREKGYGKENA